MTVKAKLILLLAVAICASIFLCIAGTLGLRETTAAIEEIGENRLPSVLGLAMMNEGQTAVRATNRWVLGWEDNYKAQDKFLDALRLKKEIWSRIDKGWNIYEPLPQKDEEAVLWKLFVREQGEWKSSDTKISDTIFSLGKNRNESGQRALFAVLMQQLDADAAKFSAAESTLEKILDLNVRVGEASVLDGKAGAAWANTAMLVVGAGAIAVLILLGVFIVHSILRQLGGDPVYVSQVARKIAAGDLAIQLEMQPGDTGSMLMSIRDMAHQLRTREQEFRAIVENSPDFIVRYDRQCRRLYVNPAMQEIFALPAEAMLGKTPQDHSPLDDAHAFTNMVQRVLASGREVLGESSFLDAQGIVRWGHTRLVPEFDANGTVISVLFIMRDISERKKIERNLEESRAQLRGLLAYREEIREEERKHIAREVHDELGQILSGLKLNISLLIHKYGGDSVPFREHALQTMQMTRHAIGVVRNITSTLRPAELEMGIVSALELVVERFSTLTGIPCDMPIEEKEIRLETNQAIALFRIVQESLTNVARHAGADRVEISLVRDEEEYVLRVLDNGKGFDVNKIDTNSFGLVGIRERAIILGGAVFIDSQPGNGTEIMVRLPKGKCCD